MRLLRSMGTSLEGIISVSVNILEKGGVVAYPTETFYGLGVRFDSVAALERLYRVKRRPEEKAIPLILGNPTMLSRVASSTSPMAAILMSRFWPGPLTLLLPAREDLPNFLTAGSGKVAVRIPGPSFALDLARALGFPITATSANISGEPPAETADTVISYFGEALDLVVDGGSAPGGRPSTIVEVSDDRVIIHRRGAIPEEEVLSALSAATTCRRRP